MSKPQHTSLTMFYTEGNPIALLTRIAGKHRRKEALTFRTAAAALAWCQLHRSVFVYFPDANSARN